MALAKRDQALRKTALNRAIRSKGYRFITLEMADPRYDGMQGADILLSQYVGEDSRGVMQFEFKIVPGPIDFVLDQQRGGKFFDLVDTERNRIFLAGHLDADGNDNILPIYGANRDEIMADLQAIQAGVKRSAVGEPMALEAKLAAKDQEIEKLRKLLAEKEKPAGAEPEGASSISGSQVAPQSEPSAAAPIPEEEAKLEPPEAPMTHSEKVKAGMARKKAEKALEVA